LDWSLADRSSVLPGAAHDDYLHAEVVATVLSWNTDSFPKGKEPTKWEDLLDMEKFPGIRGFWKNATQTLEFALLADGVSPEKVYPIDIDRALATLTKIKDKTVFWEHGAQCAQLLIDGEIELGSAWNGRLYDPKKDGAPVDYTFKESLLVTGAWIIVKGTKNAKWAKEFVAHTLDVKNQAEYSNHIPYGPVVKAAYDLIPKERLAVLPDPNMGFWQDFAYWAEHGERIHNAFSEWLVK
jgi:putative spermidine/putrescine transport system substrate-binding protein